jgi:hypothetical protein
MSLADVAPRLARARDQMREVERVLGWARDESWVGGFYVLVPVAQYTGREALEWVYVERVVQGAAPYPIRGRYQVDPLVCSTEAAGQWAFWEVAGIRFLSTDFPELLETHPDMPAEPDRSPWVEVAVAS